jgi:hypothetical protein
MRSKDTFRHLCEIEVALRERAQFAPALFDRHLAKSVHNPFEDFIKVPLQSTTGFSIGPHHNAGESLNIQPVMPFSLNVEWDLNARPSLYETATALNIESACGKRGETQSSRGAALARKRDGGQPR